MYTVFLCSLRAISSTLF